MKLAETLPSDLAPARLRMNQISYRLVEVSNDSALLGTTLLS